MRIVRFKIGPKVKTLLAKTSAEFGIVDKGFVEDVYALIRLKGAGLPTQERIDKMSKAVSKRLKMNSVIIKMLITKRKVVMKKLSGIPYFYALSTVYGPIEATTRLLTRFRSFYFKARESQCMTCALQSQCEFGQQYGDSMTNITKVLDVDFKKKVHQDCPVLPEIDFTNQLAAAAALMIQMMKKAEAPEQKLGDKTAGAAKTSELAKETEEFDALLEGAEDDEEENTDPEEAADDYQPGLMMTGKSMGTIYDGAHDGNHICKISEAFLDKVTASQLAIFELGRKIGLGLASTKKGKFAPVIPPEKDKAISSIDKISEVTKIIPSQNALPKEIFDQKLLKKQLIKSSNMKPSAKKQLLYLLMDNSASMGGQLGHNSNRLFTKGVLSSVLNMSVCRRVRDDGGIVFCRFFSGSFGPLMTARNPEEFEDLLLMIARCSYISGSTNILEAINIAQSDISTQGGDIARSEILLSTDCEDYFDDREVKAALGKVELNTLDISGAGMSGNVSSLLKSVSTHYYKANEKALNVNKLVELL